MVRADQFTGPLGEGTDSPLRIDTEVGEVGEGVVKLAKLFGEARVIFLQSQNLNPKSPEAHAVLEKIKIASNGQIVFIDGLSVDPDNLSRIGHLQSQITELVNNNVEIPAQFKISDDEAARLARKTE